MVCSVSALPYSWEKLEIQDRVMKVIIIHQKLPKTVSLKIYLKVLQ